MFLSHFKMSHHPFAENPPTDWLLTDSRFEQALARMSFFLDQGNVAMITGQTGVGKSSLIRMVRKRMPQNRYTPIYIHLTSVTPGAFLRLIVTALGEPPRFGKDRLFLQIIERVKKNDIQTVLIIDESHLISPQTLVDLRLLVSTGMEANLPLKLILCGQENLCVQLKRADLADLVNRITVRCHIKSLTREQTVSTASLIGFKSRCRVKKSQTLFFLRSLFFSNTICTKSWFDPTYTTAQTSVLLR